MLWWCCGGANIPYYTASDCPVLSDILTLSPPPPPSPAPCPLYPQQTEQTPINQHPTPQTSTVTVPERETDLTSTRTIDARHRRRHAYLTPPTKHIPIKVGQTKTKLPDKPASLSLPKSDLPAIPPHSALFSQPRGHVRPRNGPSTLPSLSSHACAARPNSASLPSPSRPSRAGPARIHDRLNPLWPPQPRSPSQKCARLFDRVLRWAAVRERGFMQSTRAGSTTTGDSAGR